MKKLYSSIHIVASLCVIYSLNSNQEEQYRQYIYDNVKNNNQKKEAIKDTLDKARKTKQNTLCTCGEEIIGICKPHEKQFVFTELPQEYSISFEEAYEIIGESCQQESPSCCSMQ